MFNVCPRCGDEFVAHVSECPDCRISLVAPGESPGSPASGAGAREAAGGLALEDAVVLRRGEASELREVAEALTEAGIACAIDTDPPGQGIGGGRPIVPTGARGRGAPLAIYVRAEDAEPASGVHQRWLRKSAPGAELALAGGMLEACPGCNEPLVAGAMSCASCGLEFPDLQVACPVCGGLVVPDAERCPHCGHRP